MLWVKHELFAHQLSFLRERIGSLNKLLDVAHSLRAACDPTTASISLKDWLKLAHNELNLKPDLGLVAFDTFRVLAAPLVAVSAVNDSGASSSSGGDDATAGLPSVSRVVTEDKVDATLFVLFLFVQLYHPHMLRSQLVERVENSLLRYEERMQTEWVRAHARHLVQLLIHGTAEDVLFRKHHKAPTNDTLFSFTAIPLARTEVAKLALVLGSGYDHFHIAPPSQFLVPTTLDATAAVIAGPALVNYITANLTVNTTAYPLLPLRRRPLNEAEETEIYTFDNMPAEPAVPYTEHASFASEERYESAPPLVYRDIAKKTMGKVSAGLWSSSLRSLHIVRCKHQYMYFLGPHDYVTIYGCKNLTIVVGAVAKAVRVQRCVGVRLICATAALTVKNCVNSSFYLFSLTRPLLKESPSASPLLRSTHTTRSLAHTLSVPALTHRRPTSGTRSSRSTRPPPQTPPPHTPSWPLFPSATRRRRLPCSNLTSLRRLSFRCTWRARRGRTRSRFRPPLPTPSPPVRPRSTRSFNSSPTRRFPSSSTQSSKASCTSAFGSGCPSRVPRPSAKSISSSSLPTSSEPRASRSSRSSRIRCRTPTAPTAPTALTALTPRADDLPLLAMPCRRSRCPTCAVHGACSLEMYWITFCRVLRPRSPAPDETSPVSCFTEYSPKWSLIHGMISCSCR
ncbi:uncharacterized protein AMSG_01027 [Thecamonas trahens ATCC 50062]|uniref:C-CAP/cofactor C-like domain-containing protein n=1 Tax=Thecamonas trahens ATCC 50062 TaxID=461836 RepID=A0A0L0DJ28_THETB|nr:hypothetical protein AMSG_01027 [Thecamonas trahens ATCC 50062]KNC52200.1 hypothetical protein AMSG_01027 [Thecamonas trahens ATCC 50062]|eukprot:XP_013762203.1 hypothetical protein AMSG_01027 [Thecamonas trahens ATCC 50062]